MSEEKNIKCPFCAEEINVDAIKCKHCGEFLNKNEDEDGSKNKKLKSFKLGKSKKLDKPEKKKRNNIANVILAVIFFLFVALFIWADDGSDTSTKKPKVSDKMIASAQVCAKEEIKTMLKSPSTAKFPWGTNGVSTDGATYMIDSYVDSQNSFGTMIRTEFLCEVTNIKINTDFTDCNVTCVIK